MGHCKKTNRTMTGDHAITHCRYRIAQKIQTCSQCRFYSSDPAPKED